MSLIDVLR